MNAKTLSVYNRSIESKILDLSKADHDFWSFRSQGKRERYHNLYYYPAMMVPQVVGEILNIICDVHKDTSTVFDPFMGAGTVLTEAMRHGLNFQGNDINPLATLVCKTKSGPFYYDALRAKIDRLFRAIQDDRSTEIDVDFPGCRKWFTDYLLIAFCKIRRAILSEPQTWARRFFWIGFGETVRRCSNSRTSTYKLHIRPTDEILNNSRDPLAIFRKMIERNYEYMEQELLLLSQKNLLSGKRYSGKVTLTSADTRSIPQNDEPLSDVVITSPPYGDNTTTIPYGQYSFLPLQWIPASDIDKKVKEESYESPYTTDAMSLGGRKKNCREMTQALCEISPAFKSTIAQLRGLPIDRENRVTAFCADLLNCVAPIQARLKSHGIMVWVLGNRKVGRQQVPLDEILLDFLKDSGCSHITTITRRIHNKRMAVKNNFAETMTNEIILVVRKGR